MTQPRSTDLRVIDADTRPTTLAEIFEITAEPWMERAMCAQTDPEAFYPDKGGSTREAKNVCRGCDVRADCLEYALDHQERHGIWGGLSERERRRLASGQTPRAHASRRHRKPLTDGQLDEVVRRYLEGQTRQHLAVVYAVSDSVILACLEDADVDIRGPGGQPARVRDPKPWADADEWQHGRHIEDTHLPEPGQEQTA